MAVSNSPITVALIDDHEIVRLGLADLIATDDRFAIVGEAGTGEKGRRLVMAVRPDVVVLDVRLPDINGVELCRDLHQQESPPTVVMLTSYTDERAELGAAMAGAAAYLLKDIHGSALLDVLATVAGGTRLIDPAAVVAKHAATGEAAGWHTLSRQERRVLDGIGEGLTNRAIAQRMYLSEATVKHYVSSMLVKLGLQRRAQAAAYVTHLHDNDAIPPSDVTAGEPRRDQPTR